MIDKICLVKDLTETEGASGFEENVVDIIKNYGKDFLFESDSLKNAYLEIYLLHLLCLILTQMKWDLLLDLLMKMDLFLF